jgi:two-component system invasion response regulator UvrY
MHTLAVIDRHPVLRAGFRLFQKKYLTGSTVLMSESLQNFQSGNFDQRPDLFILGLGMGPKMEYFKTIKTIKAQFPAALIIVYDEKPDAILLPLYIKAGVKGYLSKKNGLEELNECIRQVLSGKQYVCKQIFEINLNAALQRKAKLMTLSTREYEVANYLSQGMRITHVAQTMGIKVSTASTFKTKIFKKLLVENVLQLRDVLYTDN